tara:strand:- start:279 stop:425 length:147 start_codon:yes stop_codon:yes gene_type:complete
MRISNFLTHLPEKTLQQSKRPIMKRAQMLLYLPELIRRKLNRQKVKLK